MLIYNSDVVNAIAKYERVFGYRIKAGETAKYGTEQSFISAVDEAVKNEDPVFGGKFRKTKPPRRKRKGKVNS